MLLQVGWQVPQRIINVRYDGRLSAMQQEYVAESVLHLIKNSESPLPAPVHLVFDMENVSGIRGQLVEIVGASRLLAHFPHIGSIIMHGEATPFLHAFADFLRASLGLPVHVFSATADALQHLLHLDDSLNDDALLAG